MDLIVFLHFHLKTLNEIMLYIDRCPYPVNGNGTYIVQFDLRPDGYVKYVCNENLDLINGSLTRYCLLNQKWYGDLPVCVELPSMYN